MGIFKKFLELFGMKFTNDVSEGIVWPNAPERPDSYSIGRIPPSMTIPTSDYFLSDNEQYKEPKKTYERDSRGRFKKKGSE